MKISAEDFNLKYPVGTPVRYWPVLPPDPDIPPIETVTRSEAWNLGHGEPVVKIEGRTGGVAVAHIELRFEDDPIQTGSAVVKNAQGRQVDTDPDSRDSVGNNEATRDPIFLIQKREVHLDTINGLDLSQFHHDGDILWVDAELFSAEELTRSIADENWRARDEDFDCDGIGVNDQTLVDKGWAIVTWRTESVWFRRPEAEAWALSQKHNLGTLGNGCRVYCVCAEGRLARLLAAVPNKDVEEYLHSFSFRSDYKAYREANEKLYGKRHA